MGDVITWPPRPTGALTRRAAVSAVLALTITVALAAGCGRLANPPLEGSTPGQGSAAGLAAGSTAKVLRFPAGTTRDYRIFVPPGLDSASPDSAGPVPLVIGLHGGFGSGEQFERNSQLDALAARDRFIAAYPDGTGTIRTWNAGDCCGAAARNGTDDVRFIAALIDAVSDEYDIDPRRVFAIGHSNGGMLAYRLACELADKIVGVGAQAATLTIQPCRPSQPVSIIGVHGAADEHVPWAGGRGPKAVSAVNYLPPLEAVRTLAVAEGCPPEPAQATDAFNPDVTTFTWQPCQRGTAAQLVRVAGAGHAWMGQPSSAPALTGEAYLRYDSTAAIWDFLAAHPRQ